MADTPITERQKFWRDHVIAAATFDGIIVENAVRPFVMGRKSWLFATSVAGANASANLYSLVDTTKANGHEPYAYLLTVFTKLPAAKTLEDIEALLPFNLKPGAGNAAFDRN